MQLVPVGTFRFCQLEIGNMFITNDNCLCVKTNNTNSLMTSSKRGYYRGHLNHEIVTQVEVEVEKND